VAAFLPRCPGRASVAERGHLLPAGDLAHASMTARSNSTWEGSFCSALPDRLVSVGSPVGIRGKAWR
jgi:hypothetical protein